jgi:peptide/nickel transport system permease protein
MASDITLIKTTYRKQSRMKQVWKRLKRNRPALLGLFIIAVFAFFTIFANFIADYDTMAIRHDTAHRLQPPSSAHIFGTDEFGRDIFARTIHGARVSLSVGLVSTVISVMLGGVIGLASGYYGGRIDATVMRIVDVLLGIPVILVAISIAAALGPGITNLLIAITLAQVPRFVIIVRSMILTIVGQEYVEAARAYGSRDSHILFKHILPNAMGQIVVQATMNVSSMILSTAALSFLGMGVQPPDPEWGSMLSDGREFMRYSMHVVLYPGLAISFASLALNMLGDGLRDALDPRQG